MACGFSWLKSAKANPPRPRVINRINRVDTDFTCTSATRKQTHVVKLQTGSYCCREDDLYKINLNTEREVRPATVLNVPSHRKITREFVQDTVERFDNSDDVFDREFLEIVVFQVSGVQSPKLSSSVCHELRLCGVLEVHFISAQPFIPEGPYFSGSKGIYKIWKLLPDFNRAFIVSTFPDACDQNNYSVLAAAIPEAEGALTIAIPSRLYFPKTPEKPFNGLRICIKDNIDLQGLKTTGASRSYAQIYPPAKASAPAVQWLIERGAIIIGKTVLSQFASTGAPTGDYPEFLCGFNARGDGYRTPGGSSSGSGAAIGSYSWLDLALGTDTGGSVRGPAATQGVYGIRPSITRADSQGILMIHRDLDTLGYMSRDLQILYDVLSERFDSAATYSSTSMSFQLSRYRRLLYPTDQFPVKSQEAQWSYDNMAKSIQECLGITRVDINVAQEWKEYSKPFTKEDYREYFSLVMWHYLAWGEYHERASFRKQYYSLFGEQPYVSPWVRQRWAEGQSMSQEEFDVAKERRLKFKDFSEAMFGNDAVMITPYQFGEPDARDVYRLDPPHRDPQASGKTYREAFYAAFSGQPEVVFPVGLTATISKYTNRSVHYATVASLIGPQNAELDIVNIAKAALEHLNLPRRVFAGRCPFYESHSNAANSALDAVTSSFVRKETFVDS